MKLNQNNWQKIKLGKICKIVSGTTPNTNESLFWNGTLPWITPAEIHETSHIICETERFITEKAVEKNALKLLPKGTVLLTSRAPIGKVGIAGIEMYCNQGFKNLICSDEIYNEYLYFFLKFKSKYLDYLGRGATFKEISKSIVENVLILLPPLSEQHRIVAVLETWDKAISLTKRLIEQKEIQKKHLMRQLLTGKTRLKGFVDTWESIKIGYLYKNISNLTFSRGFLTYKQQNVAYIHYGDIHTDKLPDIIDSNTDLTYLADSVKISNEDKYLLHLGDLVIADTSEDYDGVGKSIEIADIENIKIVAGLHTIVLRPIYENKISIGFGRYLLKNPTVKNRLKTIAQGTKIYSLSYNLIKNTEIFIPSIKEQQAIAEVLSAADKEISLLKEKLAKLQQQKKGLMQILLTGKVRLNNKNK